MTITATTSEKHAQLVFMALAREVRGSSKYDMLLRFGRQLDAYGSLTPAMVAACISTISPST